MRKKNIFPFVNFGKMVEHKNKLENSSNTAMKGTFVWEDDKMVLSCGCKWEWDSGGPLDIFEGEACDFHMKQQGWD